LDEEKLNIAKNNCFKKVLMFSFLPAIFIIFFIISLFEDGLYSEIKKINYRKDKGFREYISNRNFTKSFLLLTGKTGDKIKDTIYTDKDNWLELRIDQQMLYMHSRNDRTRKFPVSTGNKHLSKSVESKPGLFAIFYKNRHHISTQFNAADMYYFMAFNMGIGFHSLNGTGYYGSLGVAPSSHGCIRMRHEDVEKVFNDCPEGTLVLAHNGHTLRTVSFAPESFEDTARYDKEEYKQMIAENLQNILEGKYYITERKFFVIDPKIIPKSGIYIGYDRKLPERQKKPYVYYRFLLESDILTERNPINISVQSESEQNQENEDITLSDDQKSNEDANTYRKEIIKKYYDNPIGILPYYGPGR